MGDSIMLRGVHSLALDAKGRVAVPSRYRAMLEAAGFPQVELIKRIDADVCIGRNIEEAIDYQILVGPSGEIVREAGAEGQRKLPAIRQDLRELMEPYLRAEGVFMPSSTWAIMARKP